MKAIITRAAARTLAAARNAARTAARTAAALGATLGTAAALLLMAACTADNLPTDPAAGTDPALTPGAVVTRIAEKPGYAPSTRTNLATGAWQTGEKVTASIYFYSDDAGKSDDALLSEATQRLTYTAATADAEAKWSAVPALVSIPAKTLSLRVNYFYNGKLDPLTGTQERMFGYVAQASGSAIYPDAPTKPFITTDSDNGRLIPIADATGTLALVPTFERKTAVVSLLMQPGQEVDFATAYLQSGWQFDESDKLYHRGASNTTATAATAHFHLDALDEAYVDANPAIAAKATFRLTLKDKPTETIYAAVPFRMGWQYQLDARTITGTGTGGDDKQSVTATGLETLGLGLSVFNAQNPVWVITGGGDDADATKAVVGNVKAALIAARNAATASGIPAGIELTLTSVKTVPTNAFAGDSGGLTSLAAVHLPAATTIGTGAFYNCSKLETVSATAATTIGSGAFQGCKALSTIALPAATTIVEGAFRGCEALSTLSLPVATNIGAQAFYGCEALSALSLPVATTIGKEAFIYCEALTTITLPAATSIGAQAFRDCKALATITLPRATSIGEEAFYYCKALTSLSLTAPGSITLDPKAFDDFDAFNGFTTTACILTLNADKKADAAGGALPKVDAVGGKQWGGKTWKEIKYKE